MFEKFKNLIFSSEYSLRERLFLVGGLTGSIAMIGVFLISFGTSENKIVSAGLVAAFFAVLAVTIYAFKTRKVDFGASVIVILINCFAFPVGYLTGGGAYSGSPIWFIVGIVFVFMVFRGKLMFFFLAISGAAFAGATFIAYRYPDVVIPLARPELIYLDTFVAAIIVSLAVGWIMKLSRDIYEEQNAKLEEQNKEIEKLNEAQNRFFSSMSHEIRTPINTIIGLNEMILRDQDISEDISENAQNIQNASKILLALINDILDLSKIQSGRMELVESQYETSRMLSEIVNLLWTRAKEKGLNFEVNVGDSIPSMLYGDEMRLKQVIINLLTNAIKYTDEGSVTLTVGGEMTEANKFTLRIDVQDTGMGIRKENIPYLFDSFRRVEQEETKHIEGTGLGLTISKQLIDLMGGSITVDSIYTKGSTFHVEIKQKIVDQSPMSFTSITEAGRERDIYEQSFEAPEAHVLIVDDNDMNRMVVRKLLRSTKVQTDLASSGKECLDKTRETHYEAIFMDHEMPDMDGVETLTRVRAQSNGLCRNTPIIALTANAGSDMSNFYMSHGFQAYLAKPINGALLEATLLQFIPEELVEHTISKREVENIHVTSATKKKPLIITTDSICDMPEDIIRAYDIRRMPYYIITEEGKFRDVQEIDSRNMFRYMEGKGTILTSPASVAEYEAFFGEALAEADTVIHLSGSSKATKGYDSALKASGSFGDVIVYDTGHVSSGLGMMVAKAVRLASAGKSPEEIIKDLDVYKTKIYETFLLPDVTVTYAHKKVSPIAAIMRKLFNMEAEIATINGKIRVTGFHIGYVTGAAHKFIRNALRNRKIDTSALIVATSGCSVEMQEDIKHEIERYKKFDKIYMQEVSAVIAAGSGRESFGLFYRLMD